MYGGFFLLQGGGQGKRISFVQLFIHSDKNRTKRSKPRALDFCFL